MATSIARRLLHSSRAVRAAVTPASSTSTPAPSSATTQPTFFKVTLMRSSIGLAPAVRATVVALGFKRRMHSVYHRIGQDSIGMILKVKELVKVESLTNDQVLQELEEQSRPRREKGGYTVVGSAL